MSAVRQVAQSVTQQLLVAANDNMRQDMPRPYKPRPAVIRTPTPANDNKYVGYTRKGRGLIVGGLIRNNVSSAGLEAIIMVGSTLKHQLSSWANTPSGTLCGPGPVGPVKMNQSCQTYQVGTSYVVTPNNLNAYKGGSTISSWEYDQPFLGGQQKYWFRGGAIYPAGQRASQSEWTWRLVARDQRVQNPGMNTMPSLDPLTKPGTVQQVNPVPWRALRQRQGRLHPSMPYSGFSSSSNHVLPRVRLDRTSRRAVVATVSPTTPRPIERPGPIQTPSTPTRPPRGVKERKAKFRNGAFAVMGRQVVDGITESMDVFEAVWESIPAWRRGQFVGNFKRANGKLPTVIDRANFVYRNAQYIDVGVLMRNLVLNQVEDAIIGRLIGGANQSEFVKWGRERGLSSPFAGPAL